MYLNKIYINILNWVKKYSNKKLGYFIDDLMLSQLRVTYVSDPHYASELEKKWLKSSTCHDIYTVRIRPFTKVGDENLSTRLALLSFLSVRNLLYTVPGTYNFTISIRCYVDKKSKTGSSFDFTKYKNAKVLIKRKTLVCLKFDKSSINSSAFFADFNNIFTKFCQDFEVFSVIELRIDADKLV